MRKTQYPKKALTAKSRLASWRKGKCPYPTCQGNGVKRNETPKGTSFTCGTCGAHNFFSLELIASLAKKEE